MERGVVSLYGLRSELFVAMNRRGRLYATVGMHINSLPIMPWLLMNKWFSSIMQFIRAVRLRGSDSWSGFNYYQLMPEETSITHVYDYAIIRSAPMWCCFVLFHQLNIYHFYTIYNLNLGHSL